MSSRNSLWHRLLQSRISRRDALRGGAAAAGAALLPLELRMAEAAPADAGPGSPAPGASQRPPFKPITPTTRDELVLPEGYRYDLIRAWGDEIAPGVPFGYNNDYIGYFPIDGPEGGRSSTDGLLWVNHENPNPLLMYGYRGGPKTPEQIRMERNAVGGSIFRVQRGRDGRWRFVRDRHNRRVTGSTRCRLTGPAAGSPGVFGATEVVGSVANCSGGVTPWGTALSCEENFQDYALPAHTELGLGYGWDRTYIPEHMGWVVEHDPYDPGHVPLKRTAMGRFRHENVALHISREGHAIGYMGDDLRDGCVYKFVSDGTYQPGNREANLRLLETGKLYAADFGRGRWLLLDYDAQPRLRDARRADGTPLFRGQADVLLDAHAAAITLGGTPTDRPEDLEVHPLTGHVYVDLTNNSRHGNFHGQIIRIREADGRHEATEFQWDFFAVGGPQSGFSSPDNAVFDPLGNLWMATDVSSGSIAKGIYSFQGNNSLFFLPTEGPDAGRAYQFASGPVECELTGPIWTPDGTTLFLAVQHPGEETTELGRFTSHWPHGRADRAPLPGVVAITGFPGWGRRR
ncbi:MAG TPA: PhoX family phosphatase [Longimicrobiaceae bacterium]|nr:PhoX family phosphatase [Longimicrobiaceae bacterium]